MAYLEDLSEYSYAPGFVRPGTRTVGWLAQRHPFPTAIPDEALLDLLWLYCSISVAQTRGFHKCEFCPAGTISHFERNGQRLLLGTSEIRVFSPEGQAYAAPTLIYHYVAVHHYKPPDEFLRALRAGPQPPSEEYFDALARLNLEWWKTSRGAPKNRILLYPYTQAGARKYLEQIGTLSDLERYRIAFHEGLIVSFYCYITDAKSPPFYNEVLYSSRAPSTSTQKRSNGMR